MRAHHTPVVIVMADNQEVIDEIFADDDSEAEFEGFEEDDLNPVINVGNIIPEFDIPELDLDDETEIDRKLGWRKTSEPPMQVPFTGNPGINVQLNEQFTAYTFFKLFVDDEFFELMSTQTNLYKSQYNDENLGPHARLRKWYDTTAAEMKQWFGLVILTGIIEKPSLDLYWSTDSLLSTPAFAQTMPRDRFMNILKCFHLNNNDNYIRRGEDGYDPIFNNL